jgi:3-oxoacyl-[acyl-carrier-protein] synthase-3
MTPDHFFPGSGGLLQQKLGARNIPSLDIRQQCAGFLYGLQVADAYIRSCLSRTVLVVGAETHTGFMPWTRSNFEYLYGSSETPPTAEEYGWNTRFRHLTVLFGDAAAAVVVRAETDGDHGILDSLLRTDGTDFDRLYVPGAGFKHRPYVDAGQLSRGEHIPVMDGRFVFKSATTRMAAVTREILDRNRLSINDLAMVLMHQANRHINDYVQRALGIPDDKVLHNIHKYGNTTAATIPLLWDEAVRSDRIRSGDLVLMVSFGAGMNWGAVLIRA